jgi:hypothetical protein
VTEWATVSDVVGMVCWSCGVPTRPGQRFCNSCGVALAGTDGGLSLDETPTDQVPVVGDAPAVDDLDQFFDTTEFQVVEQMPANAERIGRLAAEDPTPPHGTMVTSEFGVDTDDEYDQYDDFSHFDHLGLSVGRRLLIVGLAAATAVALAAASLFTVLTMDTTGSVSLHLVLDANGFTSNAMVAGLVGVVLLLVGAIAAARGHRFAVGLIGGVGAASAGLMVWIIGQAITFVDSAKHVLAARGGTYRLHLVLDIGFFLAVCAAVLGGACLLVSVFSAHDPGERRAHPAIGALGALGSLVLAVGAFLPTKSGHLADNFSSAHPIAGGAFRKSQLLLLFHVDYQPVPPIATWFRLLLIVLLLVGGMLGFLRASRWGLGMAIGSVSVSVWIWITSMWAIGDLPYGIGGGNAGSTGHPPHIAVTVGLVVVAIGAIAHALWWWRQVRSEFAAT